MPTNPTHRFELLGQYSVLLAAHPSADIKRVVSPSVPKGTAIAALRLEMVYKAAAQIVGVSIRPTARGSNRVRGGV